VSKAGQLTNEQFLDATFVAEATRRKALLHSSPALGHRVKMLQSGLSLPPFAASAKSNDGRIHRVRD
jgi:hypothetical protein